MCAQKGGSTAPSYLPVLHKLAYMTVKLSPDVHDGCTGSWLPYTLAYMISTQWYIVVHDWHPGCTLYYICIPSQLVYIHFLEPLVHNGLQMYNGFLTCVGNHSFNRLGNKNLEI